MKIDMCKLLKRSFFPAKLTALSAAVWVLSGLSCSGMPLTKKEIHNMNRIIYTHDNGSLPPKFHRHYSIQVTPDQILLIVEDYEKTLVNQTFPSNEENFNKLILTVNEAGFSNTAMRNPKGCTGGKTESIKLYNNDTTIFKGRILYCGGREFGDLRGDLKSVGTLMRSFISGFSDLMR